MHTTRDRHSTEPPAAAGRPARETGSVLVLVLVTLIPLLLLATVAGTLTATRNGRLLAEIQDYRALLAAESGLDEVLYRARNGTLTPGATFTLTPVSGANVTVESVELGSDGNDNDVDGSTDEPDEAMLEVTITGTHGRAVRRIVAYLGGTPGSIIPPLEAAVTTFADTDVSQSNMATMNGVDVTIAELPGDPANNVMGLAVVPPATAANVVSLLSQSGSSSIVGTGTNPDVHAGTSFDLPALVAWVQANADVTLTGNVSGGFIGDAATSDYKVVYGTTNINFSGTSGGAGILVINGGLGVSGSFHWVGLVVVMGNFSGSGGAHITGAMIQGPGGANISMSGSDSVRFSTEALQMAGAGTGTGGVPTLIGWHETSRF